MNKLLKFFKDSYREMIDNVTWTKYAELQNQSILVLIASFIFALIIGLMDFSYDELLGVLYNALIGTNN